MNVRVSEMFESVQGEGATAGTSSFFLRLAVCNLRCTWCDTKYSWDWAAYRYADEVHEIAVGDVATRIRASTCEHLVVTGGEPLLQDAALVELVGILPDDRYIEVETNGTLAPSPELARRVDQWNVSPKLSNSGERRERRLVPKALAAFRATERAWLKIVVESDSDLAELDALLAELAWPKERTLVMPQAASRATLLARAPFADRLARGRGIGVSPRLHIERWDGQRGV